MKGGFKNALPWMVLLVIVLLSVGVSMVVVEGLVVEKDNKLEKEGEKERMKRLINLVT